MANLANIANMTYEEAMPPTREPSPPLENGAHLIYTINPKETWMTAHMMEPPERKVSGRVPKGEASFPITMGPTNYYKDLPKDEP